MAEILVCDDDKDIVEAIEIYLAQEGHHILKAYDGEQAIRVLQNNPVDLLIIDVMMPKLDGIRATLKIREKNALPIIILSAKSDRSSWAGSRQAFDASHTMIIGKTRCAAVNGSSVW